MMVASSSLLKLEQSHNRFITPDLPSPDMAYHMSRLPDGQRTTFTTQTDSFSVNDQIFRLPSSAASKDERAGSENHKHHRKHHLNDRLYEGHTSELYSPKEDGILSQNDMFDPTSDSQSNSIFDDSNRSPTRFQPPSKRMATSSPLFSPKSMGLSSREPVENTRTDVLERKQAKRKNSSHDTFDAVFPKEEQFLPEFQNSSNVKFANAMRDKAATMTSDVNGNMIVTSPSSEPASSRHLSLSSTHSSSSTASKPMTPSRPLSRTKSQPPTTPQQVPFAFDDDDDDSWKICAVCSDKATGYHFNALTCEGCKGFFRRSMKNSKTFTCPYTGNCTITKSNRRQCQACRLQKCLKIGMKKECIMSNNQILMKKNLMLNNKIKKNLMEWKPSEFTPDKKELVEMIYSAHCQTNIPPPISITKDESIQVEERNPAASPASSHSSGFSDLIDRMTQDIAATAPGPPGQTKSHMRHFSSILEFGIKEIIKFCKKIPTFINLSLKDQITLLKSGCTEILFIKANYTYDREVGALTCGPGKHYTRQSFILGGMSEEYTDCYLKFHHDLSHMRLDDTELACMCAATLFSSDRDELENRPAVERQQEEVVTALQMYTENTYHCRVRFPKIMAYLVRLRNLNWHISRTLQTIQDTESKVDISPLVLEVTPTT